MALTMWMASLASTSKVIVLPVEVLGDAHATLQAKCKVDSSWSAADLEGGAALTLSGCCNLTMCGRAQAACLRRLFAADGMDAFPILNLCLVM